MQWPLGLRALEAVCALTLCLVLTGSHSVRAQTISDLDTLRIIDVSNVMPGNEFDLDISITNSVALGAFNFRIRYDPSAIEPVPDTTIIGPDTLVEYSLQLLRGADYGSVSADVSEPGVFVGLVWNPFGPPPGPLQPGSGPVMRSRWRARYSAVPITTVVAFENHPQFPFNYNTLTDLSTSQLILPTQVSGEVTRAVACDCSYRGDVNGNTIAFEIGDAVLTPNIIFRDASLLPLPQGGCDVNPADVDCNGRVDAIDLLRILYVITGYMAPDQGACIPCGTTAAASATGAAQQGGSR